MLYNQDDLYNNGTTNTYTIHIQIQKQEVADSVVQVRTHLLTSEFGSLTRGERNDF